MLKGGGLSSLHYHTLTVRVPDCNTVKWKSSQRHFQTISFPGTELHSKKYRPTQKTKQTPKNDMQRIV